MTSVFPQENYLVKEDGTDVPHVMNIQEEEQHQVKANFFFGIYIIIIIVLACLPYYTNVTKTEMTIYVTIFTVIGGMFIAKIYAQPLTVKKARIKALRRQLGLNRDAKIDPESIPDGSMKAAARELAMLIESKKNH